MKKYFNLIVALVAMLFAGNSFAFTPPPAPAQGWYVVDQTGKLSEEQKAALNLKIDQVSKTTKNEFGILFLNTMDGDNIEDVAYTTFNTWGIGKRGLDNGVLIVVSLQERKSRIETGKGVGGEVTDLQSKQILDNTLRPFLKKGDFAGGFNATLDALSSLIESRHNQKAAPVDTTASRVSNDAPASCALAAAGVGATDGGSSGVGWVVFLLLGGGFVVWRLRAASKRRAADRQAALDAEELRQNRLAAQRREAQRRETQRLENANRLERERVAHETVRPRVYPPVSTTLGAPPIAPPKVAVPETNPYVRAAVVAASTGVTAGVLAAEAERRLRDREREETKARVEQEKENNRRHQRDEDDRRRRERDEEDRRKRQRDDDDRRSSSSSSSDYGFGGGSSSGGGGGFDGGSSGGGGASSDW
jgi:uncharacterized protein